jgi:hypothetical protein
MNVDLDSTACRAATSSPAQTIRFLPGVLFALFVGGFWGAGGYMRNISIADKFDPVKVEFDLWTAVLGVLGGFAAAAGLYFVCWLVGIVRLHGRVDVWAAASWLGVVLVVGGTVLASLFIASSGADESVDKSLAVQTRPVTLVIAVCVTPGLLGFMALRAIARKDDCWQESNGCRLRLVLRLRAELRRLLAILGAFLTLLVVATGMRRHTLLALDADLHIPAEEVLLYGLVFAGMLGLFYVTATTAIDARAGRLLDEFAPLPDPLDPQSSDRIHRRNDLAGLIGLGGSGSWRTFESTVVVAAPLVSALIGASTGG